MNINFIVSFNRRPQVMFDIDISTDGADYDGMLTYIQMQAFICLRQNGLDTKDVWKISTAADWTNTWCREHGPLPDDFKETFNGKFYYNEDRTLHDIFGKIFNLSDIKRLTESEKLPLVAQVYTVDEYLAKAS